jgi:predicted branched-subunit amino acid permease
MQESVNTNTHLTIQEKPLMSIMVLAGGALLIVIIIVLLILTVGK